MQEQSTVHYQPVPARDFTYEMYDALITVLRNENYSFTTLREYLTESDLPRKLVVLRHDIDRKPENALDIARIEASQDVTSTYYFRTIEKTFKPSLIREIESLGHEIGYHYEDMDRTGGDVWAARKSFADHLERLRMHVDVDTVCMHGNPLTRYDNRDMWSGNETKMYDTYDLAGEAYLSVDFTDLIYFSDTGRIWRDGSLKVKDHTVGQDAKSVQVDGTPDLIDHIRSGDTDRFYLLTHPNRWAANSFELLVEATKDSITNLGKYVLQATTYRHQ